MLPQLSFAVQSIRSNFALSVSFKSGQISSPEHTGPPEVCGQECYLSKGQHPSATYNFRVLTILSIRGWLTNIWGCCLIIHICDSNEAQCSYAVSSHKFLMLLGDKSLQVARTHALNPFYVAPHLGQVFSTIRCYHHDILNAHTPDRLVLGQYLLVYEP